MGGNRLQRFPQLTELASILEVHAVEEFDDINRDQGWDIEYRQLQRGGFRALMRAFEAAGALVSYEVVTGPLEIHTAEPDDSVALFMPTCPLGQARFNGYLVDGRRAFLVSSGAEIQFLSNADASCHIVRIPSSRFESNAGAVGLDRPLQRAETRLVESDDHKLCGIRRAVDGVLSIDQQAPDTVEPSVVHLVESVAELPTNQDGDQEYRHSDPRAFRRALEFIDANVKSDVSSLDLCEVACLQRRSLERLFKKEFGISPLQYILARRMNVVRRQLLVSDANEVCVSAIAHDHGFTHLGRFSGVYREFFSELPSETLKSPVSSSATG